MSICIAAFEWQNDAANFAMDLEYLRGFHPTVVKNKNFDVAVNYFRQPAINYNGYKFP